MAKIVQLDESVYNKIAAGEVIEKPASVVKELVENALDAGATHISVAIRQGGLQRISVTDNGSGIAPQDLPKVFLPHATSKIATAEDLFAITTLGFRGEAMASIAAVAMVELTSRVRDSDAYRIVIEGGVIRSQSIASADFGTTVEVCNLFYNTPARLKFLKSVKSEQHDVTALIERIMIANPNVRFEYTIDDKIVYATTGNGLEEVVHCIYDDDTCDHLLPIQAAEYGYRLHGFVSDTLFGKGTRGAQTTVLNGRVVSNATLTATINNAYRNYLMKRNFPVIVLHITIPAEEVDVNVHPTKADVRFAYGNKLFGFVYRAIGSVLSQSEHQNKLVFDQLISGEVAAAAMPATTRGAATVDTDLPDLLHDAARSTDTIDSLDSVCQRTGRQEPVTSVHEAAEQDSTPTPQEEFRPLLSVAEPNRLRQTYASSSARAVQEPCIDRPATATVTCGFLADTQAKTLRIVGQVLGTYIVAEYDNNLLLIDQHAAAERVLYDRLMQQYADEHMAIQPLLLPYEFELSPHEADRLAGQLDSLNRMGIELTVSDDVHFALYSLPALLTDMDILQFVHLLLADDYLGGDKDMVKDKLAYAACRSAVKGNTQLDNEALRLLCDNLFADGIPTQCPHGRPAFVQITRSQLEHMFRRKV